MKLFSVTLFTALFGLASNLGAANLCCGSIEVGGQAIYLRPTSCDFDYVIVDSRPFDANTQAVKLPQQNARSVDPDYEWGFRASLGYVTESNCYDARIEYTYLHSHDRASVGPFEAGGPGIWPVNTHPSFAISSPWFGNNLTNPPTPARASSKLKFDYDALDLQLGSRSTKGCNLWLRKYIGLHLMNLDNSQQSRFEGSSDPLNSEIAITQIIDVSSHRNIWGIGPLFGLDARYVVACNFGIGGHVGTGIVAGETHSTRREFDTLILGNSSNTQPLEVSHDDRSVLFPFIRGSLGINYLWCCGNCFNLMIEFGYEFTSYINTIGDFRFNDQRGTGQANCDSFNLDGFYLSLRATL